MSIEIFILCSESRFEMLNPAVKWRGEHRNVCYMLSVAHYDAHWFFRCRSSDVVFQMSVALLLLFSRLRV